MIKKKLRSCLRDGSFGGLARRDVTPRADHLGRLTALVVDDPQLIADPAVVAILLEKPVLDGMATLLVQVAKLGLHPGEVVGMRPAPPEIRALQIVARLIA